MPLLRSRTNLITVRLSDEEHYRLKRACENGGARSISDFVREIIVQRVSASHPGGNRHLSGDLETIASKLHQLDLALHELSDRIVNLLGRDRQDEEIKCKMLS